MLKFETGLLEKTRLLSNVLMLVLVAGNIFFSIQYSEGLKRDATAKATLDNQVLDTTQHIAIARFLKEFIDVVLNTKGAISFEDRVKLENDVQQLHDLDILKDWDAFVNSKDAATAQSNTVKLMSLLANKMLVDQNVIQNVVAPQQ